jgi:hypothetical protein
MITQDKLAAATLAQIFGSELRRVDENTTMQSSMTGPAVRIDPKQILVGSTPNTYGNLTPEQRKIMAAVNAEAAATHPKYDEPAPQPVYQQPSPVLQQTINPIRNQTVPMQQPPTDQNQLEFSFPPPGSPGFELFEKINKNLERIARAIENIQIDKESKKSE